MGGFLLGITKDCQILGNLFLLFVLPYIKNGHQTLKYGSGRGKGTILIINVHDIRLYYSSTMKQLAWEQDMTVNFLSWQTTYKKKKVYFGIVLEDTVYHQADPLAFRPLREDNTPWQKYATEWNHSPPGLEVRDQEQGNRIPVSCNNMLHDPNPLQEALLLELPVQPS